MTEQLQLILIIVGLALIAGLGFFIFKMLEEERRLKRERAEAQQQLLELAHKQRNHLIDSIKVISQAMLTDQCGLTEGCIRLKVLLEQLAPALLREDDFKILVTVYDATSHIPILDEWKKLKLRQRVAFTEEREALEEAHRKTILQASRRLTEYDFGS